MTTVWLICSVSFSVSCNLKSVWMALHIGMWYPGKQPWKRFQFLKHVAEVSLRTVNKFLKEEVEVGGWNESLLLTPLCFVVLWTFQLQGSYCHALLALFQVFVLTNAVSLHSSDFIIASIFFVVYWIMHVGRVLQFLLSMRPWVDLFLTLWPCYWRKRLFLLLFISLRWL